MYKMIKKVLYCYHMILLIESYSLIRAKKDCYNRKSHGETWRTGPCQICECEDGMIYCKSSCIKNQRSSEKYSSNVIKVTSDYCQHSGRMIGDKEVWHEKGIHASSLDPRRECMQCQCNRGIVTCTIRSCPDTSSCRNPEVVPGSCCRVCPTASVQRSVDSKSSACFQSGSLFAESSTWKMYIPVKKKLGRCLQCSCLKNKGGYNHVCKQLKCPTLTCQNPIGKLGQCCGTCKGSRSRSSVDDDFRRSNMMTIDMLLENGITSSSTKESTEIIPPTSIDGKNVDKISNLDCVQFGNKVYRHNEHFTPEDFKCLRCRCRNSKVQCDKVVCPLSYPCRNPETRKGLCCKTCPHLSDEQARKIEDQNVARIGKKRTGSCSQNDDRIQVYVFDTGEDPPNALKMHFLFERPNQQRNKPYEMHSIELEDGRGNVKISKISKDDLQISQKWRHIGSFKEKILKRVKKHEDDLIKLNKLRDIILKMDAIRKMIIEKARRKRPCKSKVLRTRQTSKILQALQEVEKGK